VPKSEAWYNTQSLEVSLDNVYRSTVLLLLSAGSLMSQGAINTLTSWDGAAFVEPFGVPSAATYGQTITVAADSGRLVSFGFEMGNCRASGNVSVRGEVYAWDGSKATGSPLFESPTTAISGSGGIQLVTFYPGGLNLTPGAYVLFATTSRDQVGAPFSECQWGVVAAAAYPGGYVFMNNETDTSLWTSTAWLTPAEAVNLAFQVNVAAAPVGVPAPAGVPAASPTTLLLGGAGVIGLGLLGLSRFRIAR
jgi:hypothetical protein